MHSINSPTPGSLGFNLEDSGLQDAFLPTHVPTATASYPIESDYIAPNVEAQLDPSTQLGAFPVHYQTAENEVAMRDVPFIAPGLSEGVVPGTENLASLSYDGY